MSAKRRAKHLGSCAFCGKFVKEDEGACFWFFVLISVCLFLVSCCRSICECSLALFHFSCMECGIQSEQHRDVHKAQLHNMRLRRLGLSTRVKQ